MSKALAEWIDNLLSRDIDGNVVAFCFNLYQEGDGTWSMELVGTDSFDLDDEDWACGEVTDFGSRDSLYVWKMECEWDEALAYMANELRSYLTEGKYAGLLKSRVGVGVGFVDGNIEILYNE